jgi:hypothetical protein
LKSFRNFLRYSKFLDIEKFQEWDQQKQGLSYIGTTAYEYKASGKDEISFEKGRVVEVMRIDW